MRTRNYTKLFSMTHPINQEPLTILVDAFTPIGGEILFTIKSLEGEFDTREEFDDVREYVMQGVELAYKYNKHTKDDDKLYSSMTLNKSGLHHLITSLNEAIAASEED